ncbi:MAG: triple tyrosine motif-containing protein [Bryobacteraceae bacterium]
MGTSGGDLWVGTLTGVARLVAAATPPHFKSYGGQLQSGGDAGAGAAERRDIQPSENHMDIDYAGISTVDNLSVRYQYRLEGADKEWGAAGRQLSVVYSNIQPGRYCFLARALGRGAFNPDSRTVAFRVLPHVWQRA